MNHQHNKEYYLLVVCILWSNFQTHYSAALWIKSLSTGRSILPHRDWPGNVLPFSWIKAKAHSLTAFL